MGLTVNPVMVIQFLIVCFMLFMYRLSGRHVAFITTKENVMGSEWVQKGVRREYRFRCIFLGIAGLNFGFLLAGIWNAL